MNIHTTGENLNYVKKPKALYRKVIWLYENYTRKNSDLIENENFCLDFLKYSTEFCGSDIIVHCIPWLGAKTFQKVSIFYHINVFSGTLKNGFFSS